MGILDDLPRGVPDDKKRPPGLPGARWAGPAAIVNARHRDNRDEKIFEFSNEKIFCGMVDGMLVGLKDDRHAMMVAGSRAGKGRSVLIPTLLEYAGSTLVIDPKAELASITARRRGQGGTREDGVKIEGLGQDVKVLDPFGIGADWLAPYRATFNPMARLDPEDESIVEDAGAIADAIIVRSGERDAHWDESALDFLKGLILHVATFERHEGRRNLITVHELLTRAEDTEDGRTANLEIEMRENEAVEGRVHAAAANFYGKPDNERGSVLSTVLRNASFLDSPAMRRVLVDDASAFDENSQTSHRLLNPLWGSPLLNLPELKAQKAEKPPSGNSGKSIDLSELKTAAGGMTIYLCLPATRMATHGRWFRLFINMALEEMGRTAGMPATGLQTLFVLDEFHTLGHMQVIATAAALMAGDPYHVKLWTILQDLSQLKHLYKEQWETFLGNAGVVQFFGNNDMTTLQAASARLGKTPVLVERGSEVSRQAEMGGATGG